LTQAVVFPETVLHLNTEIGWRGGEAQTLRLAQGLEARGHRCLVAGREQGELLKRAAAAGLAVVPLESRGEFDLRAARRLSRILKAERVDLLHAHTAHAVTLCTLATLFQRSRPALVAARRLSFPLRSSLWGRFKYGFRVDRVIAVSEAIRRLLVRQGLRADRVAVVHSGIDPERFRQGDRLRFRSSLRPFLGDEADSAFLVGSVGHLAAHKGLDIFLAAAAQVAREVPAARFILIGRGEAEGTLRRDVDRLGLASRVVFAGFRDDMPDVFAGLDLLVLSSVSGEGSPAVVKEAMAAGTPLVATALDGLEEIVEDARHGLLVPPGNAPALGRAIAILAQDAALRARYSAAALRRVMEFTADAMVEKTESVYRSIGPPALEDGAGRT
jgi:glycosyltransferase involved in cell wall biosynthesis